MSFFPKTIPDWNGLPQEVVTAESLDCFTCKHNWKSPTHPPSPPPPPRRRRRLLLCHINAVQLTLCNGHAVFLKHCQCGCIARSVFFLRLHVLLGGNHTHKKLLWVRLDVRNSLCGLFLRLAILWSRRLSGTPESSPATTSASTAASSSRHFCRLLHSVSGNLESKRGVCVLQRLQLKLTPHFLFWRRLFCSGSGVETCGHLYSLAFYMTESAACWKVAQLLESCICVLRYTTGSTFAKT